MSRKSSEGSVASALTAANLRSLDTSENKKRRASSDASSLTASSHRSTKSYPLDARDISLDLDDDSESGDSEKNGSEKSYYLGEGDTLDAEDISLKLFSENIHKPSKKNVKNGSVSSEDDNVSVSSEVGAKNPKSLRQSISRINTFAGNEGDNRSVSSEDDEIISQVSEDEYEFSEEESQVSEDEFNEDEYGDGSESVTSEEETKSFPVPSGRSPSASNSGDDTHDKDDEEEGEGEEEGKGKGKGTKKKRKGYRDAYSEESGWPKRINYAKLSALGYCEDSFGNVVAVPKIVGVSNAKTKDQPDDSGWQDKSFELHESGLFVASYYGKSGLADLAIQVSDANNDEEITKRNSAMSIARIINPKEDDSADIYCLISSSKNYGTSTTYISKSTFDEISKDANDEYCQALKATAKLEGLKNARDILRNQNVENVDWEDSEDDDRSVDGDKPRQRDFEEKVEQLEHLISDAEKALDTKSNYFLYNGAPNPSKKYEDFFAKVRKIIANDLATLTADGDALVVNYKDLGVEKEKEIESLLKTFLEEQGEGYKFLTQEEIYSLFPIDDSRDKNEKLKQLYEIAKGTFGKIQDAFPTRSLALRKAAEYDLGKEFGSYGLEDEDLIETIKETKLLDSQTPENLKKLKTLTPDQRDVARRIASNESFRKFGEKIENSMMKNVDFTDEEKNEIANQMTSFLSTTDKKDKITEFLKEAKLPNSPYAGPSVLRPARRSDIATVVFKTAGPSKEGYQGDDIMYLHVQGTMPPHYVKAQVATSDNQKITVYENGTANVKTFGFGEIAMDSGTAYTKDVNGNYIAHDMSSSMSDDRDTKANKTHYNHFKVKAMSVIGNERHAAILFDGKCVAPKGLISKVDAVSDRVSVFGDIKEGETPKLVTTKSQIQILLPSDVNSGISIVTINDLVNKGKVNKDLYFQDARDPKNTKLYGPLTEGNFTHFNEKLLPDGSNFPDLKQLKNDLIPSSSFAPLSVFSFGKGSNGLGILGA